MNAALRIKRELAQVLNEVLRDKRWNQTDVARELQTTQPRISRLQRGQLDEISLEQLIQWLAAVGHGVVVKVVEREVSPRTERREHLHQLGRTALEKGELQAAKLWSQMMWHEFPLYGPAGALRYDVLMACGHTIDAQPYRRFKDSEPAERILQMTDMQDPV